MSWNKLQQSKQLQGLGIQFWEWHEQFRISTSSTVGVHYNAIAQLL